MYAKPVTWGGTRTRTLGVKGPLALLDLGAEQSHTSSSLAPRVLGMGRAKGKAHVGLALM